MTATNRDKSFRLQLSGRNIAGARLAVCGFLITIWGGTLESVSVTDPDFMSSVVSGLVVIAVRVRPATTSPRATHATLIWLATLTLMFYLFILGITAIVSLMGCVVIAGIAAWLTTRILG